MNEQQPVAEKALVHDVHDGKQDGLGVNVDLEVERTGSEGAAPESSADVSGRRLEGAVRTLGTRL